MVMHSDTSSHDFNINTDHPSKCQFEGCNIQGMVSVTIEGTRECFLCVDHCHDALDEALKRMVKAVFIPT